MFNDLNARYQRALSESSSLSSMDSIADFHFTIEEDATEAENTSRTMKAMEHESSEDQDEDYVVSEAAYKFDVDKIGAYNSAIKSGKIDYDSNSCEDRGGVGVNTIMDRNNQLSESVSSTMYYYALSEASMFYEADRAIDQMINEGAETAKSSAKNALVAIWDWIKEKCRDLMARIKRFIDRIVENIKKFWNSICSKWNARGLGAVHIATKIYDPEYINRLKSNLDKLSKTCASPNAALTGTDEKDFEAISDAIEIDTTKKSVSIDEAIKMLDKFPGNEIADCIKLVETSIGNLKKFIDTFDKSYKALTPEERDNTDTSAFKMAKKLTDRLNNRLSTLNKIISTHSLNADAVTAAEEKLLKALTKDAKGAKEKMNKNALDNRETVAKLMGKIKDAKSMSKINNKQPDAPETPAAEENPANESAMLLPEAAVRAAEAYGVTLAEAKAAGLQFMDGYMDEATGMYFFADELNEAAGLTDTYSETPVHLKTSGELKVEVPEKEACVPGDAACKDPEQPDLKGAVSEAKATLCKAYTADQLKTISHSDMAKVHGAVSDLIANKTEAIKTLKEAYEMNLDSDYSVRSAILEDAAAIQSDLSNLNNTRSILESLMDTIDESVFKLDDDFLFEDALADLEDFTKDVKEDKASKSKDSDEDKDEDEEDKPKSKKSKSDDKEDEDKDEDKDSDDDSDEDDDSKSKSKKKSDKDEDDDKEDDKSDKSKDSDKDDSVDESAYLLNAITSMMDLLD